MMSKRESILERELAGVGTNLDEITDMTSRIEEPGPRGSGDEQDEVSFRVAKKKVGAAAVKAHRAAKRQYRKGKGRAKRAAARFRRTSAYKKWTKLRKRLAPKLKKLAGTGKRLILRREGAGYASANLAESIRAHMAEADAGGFGLSEDLIEALETSVRSADIALDLARRYDHLEDDATCDALLDMAEGLIDLSDAVEQVDGDTMPESLDAKLTSLVAGLHESLQDYMGEHYVRFDEDEEDDEATF
jgi:hypothetical protein